MQQIVTWQEHARNAIGTSVPIAIRGAAATVAAAAAGLAEGIVKGASSALAGQQGPIESVPVPDS